VAFFFLWRNSPTRGLGRLIVEVLISHADTAHWVKLLRMSDRPVSEIST
jgi:hypothetical protein